MKKLIFTFFGMFFFSLLFGQTSLSICAFIDGKDQLIITDTTVQWLHHTHAAPGRLSHQNLPTYLNGQEWYPAWPDVPDDENRVKCYSSVFSDLSDGLPQIEQNYSLNKLQARGDVFIVQQPRDSNNFTLIIEFDDTSPVGADWYEVSIDSILTEIISVANSEYAENLIYPNPTTGVIEIATKRLENKNYNIVVFNNQGIAITIKPIYQDENSIQLDLSQYPSGMYFVRIVSDDIKYQYKIIKK